MKRAACYDVPKYHKMLWEEQQSPQSKKTGQTGDAKVAGFSDGIMPELFHRLYATTPNKIENPGPAASARKRIHDLISELPEFQTLRKQTVRDTMWSGMATSALSDTVVAGLPKQEDAPDVDAAQNALAGLQHLAEEHPDMPGLQDRIDQAQKDLQAAQQAAEEQASGLDETAVRGAARKGIQKAQKDISDTEGALNSLGYGRGSGSGLRNPAVAVQIARKIATSEKLKRIVEVAGRLRAIARAKRVRRTEYARSEMLGVEQTGDIGRLVPSELAYLSHPAAKMALMRKIVDREAIGYRMQGKAKVGKGPIILVVDQSGSMQGDKDVWAKGIGLALLDAARAENRSFGIILYDDGVRAKFLAPDPQKVDPLEILNVMSTDPNGGTEFAKPLTLAMQWIHDAPKFSKADIVHVTDGDASTAGAQEFKERAEAQNVSVYGIGIGLYNTHCLQAWSTEPVTAITDVRQDTAAVDTIFNNI